MTTEELIRDFSEGNFSDWCRGKFADFVPKSERLDEGDFSRARQIGYVRTLAEDGVNRPLLVAAVQVPGELGERSSRKRQFDFARKALQRAMDRPPGQAGGLFTQGLFVFYGENGDFRMSLISGRVEGGKLAYNSFKRQTFFVRHNEVNRTFLTQMEKGLGDYEALCAAFSIEALTKQFYNELFAWYEWALSDEMDVRFPNDIHTDMDNRELIPEHMIRLITRLMFVWFIKQKHLVPEEIFKVEELRKLLKDFDPDSETEGNYYNAILQNLFFATLNNKIEDRDFAANGTTRAENENHYGVKTLFRNPKGDTWFKVPDDKILKLFEKVPFLNGGLFECLDRPEDEKSKRILYYDGFSREEKVKGKLTRAFVPNGLFFDKERGLIPLFQRYNFTVEENSPNDAEVALDPELLGKVFENLLGAYNPETKETARKQSGSFYTPREIVSYMVDESLKQYLKTQVQMDDAVLASLFEEDAKVDLPAAKRKELATAIRSVKILDPACGSGAFPMGALHRLVDLLVKLDGQADNLYDLKLYLIENCIYGVDIQTIAVQISKLRFFISLVCEQQPNNRKDNYGILPLPNLETKFVVANTLIGLEKKLAGDLNLEDEEIAKLRKELWDIRHRHFLSKSSQEKHTCRRQDKAVREKIQKRIVAIASTPDKGKIAHLEESIRKLEAEKIKYRGEKWETISVPTQGDLFGGKSDNAAQKIRVDTNKAKREELDERIERCERDIAAEKGKKVSRELVEAAENLAAWDPYDQNDPSPFFDPEWMFGAKNGFDIIIANPPYVEAKKLKEIAATLRGKYEVYSGTADLSCYFYERGLDLCKPGGTLCFISTNKFFNTGYGEYLRKYILKNTIVCLVNFEQVEVFENVLVSSVVIVLHKCPPPQNNSFHYEKFYKCGRTEFLEAFSSGVFSKSTYDQAVLSSAEWSFADDAQLKLKEKIEANATRLFEIEGIEVYRGITTGFNPAFIISEEVRREFISKEKHSKNIIKPLLQGRNIKKWRYENENKTYLLQTGYDLNIKAEYKEVFKHLRRYENELTVRADQGSAWWNLRACSYYGEFERPEKIIWGLTADQWAFAYDDHGYYLPSNGYILTSKRVPIKYLLALLNSTLFRYYFSFFGIMTAGGAYTLKHTTIIEMPVIIAPKMQPFIVLVDKILAIKAKEPSADVSALEAEIDQKVYEIYSLSKDEVAIIHRALASYGPVENKGDSLARAVKSKAKSALMDDEGLD